MNPAELTASHYVARDEAIRLCEAVWSALETLRYRRSQPMSVDAMMALVASSRAAIATAADTHAALRAAYHVDQAAGRYDGYDGLATDKAPLMRVSASVGQVVRALATQSDEQIATSYAQALAKDAH